MTTTTTELAVITVPKKDALAVFTTDGALDPFLARLRAEIDEFKPDLSTAASRKKIASVAYRVSQVKTSLDDIGQRLVAEQKLIPNKIDATRRAMREKLDKWRDEVRAPLDEWENIEKARVARHHKALDQLRALANCARWASEQIAENIRMAEAVAVDASCEEFAAEYAIAKASAISQLQTSHRQAVEDERERQELANLRAKVEEQQKRDHEAQIAERAKADERRKSEAAALKAEQENAAALKAERDANERRELQLKLAAESAERRALQAKETAENELQAKADQELLEKAARERDRAHKSKINRAAMGALIDGGVPDATAKLVVELIAKRLIPSVSINY